MLEQNQYWEKIKEKAENLFKISQEHETEEIEKSISLAKEAITLIENNTPDKNDLYITKFYIYIAYLISEKKLSSIKENSEANPIEEEKKEDPFIEKAESKIEIKEQNIQKEEEKNIENDLQEEIDEENLENQNEVINDELEDQTHEDSVEALLDEETKFAINVLLKASGLINIKLQDKEQEPDFTRKLSLELINIYNSLGELYRISSIYRKSENYYSMSIEECQKISSISSTELASSQFSLGCIKLVREKYSEGLSFIQQSEKTISDIIIKFKERMLEFPAEKEILENKINNLENYKSSIQAKLNEIESMKTKKNYQDSIINLKHPADDLINESPKKIKKLN